jgi:hypothetical protein
MSSHASNTYAALHRCRFVGREAADMFSSGYRNISRPDSRSFSGVRVRSTYLVKFKTYGIITLLTCPYIFRPFLRIRQLQPHVFVYIVTNGADIIKSQYRDAQYQCAAL